MVYRNREKLTIIKLQSDEKVVSFGRMMKIILNKPSNVIYCECNGKLYGIITMGDIGRASKEGKKYVIVNTHFTWLMDGEYMRARQIFYERDSINALPVVNNNRSLIGDWCRWDDLSFLRNKVLWGDDVRFIKTVRVAFVRPCSAFAEKLEVYNKCCNKLMSYGESVVQIRCDEVLAFIDDVEWILTVDEDERRALDTLYRFIQYRENVLGKIKSLRWFIESQDFLEFDLAAMYLNSLLKKGVHILDLVFHNYNSDYMKKLNKDIAEKFAAVGEKVSGMMNPIMYSGFFDDLADEKYIDDILHIPFRVVNKCGQMVLGDCKSPYYNVSNGERLTVGQPQHYKKTIYFVGPCFVYGIYVEDKNTIESLLQKRINDAGYRVRVVNCGSPAYTRNMGLTMARILGTQIKKVILLLFIWIIKCVKIFKFLIYVIL